MVSLPIADSLEPAERDAALTMCMIGGGPGHYTNVTPGKSVCVWGGGACEYESVCVCGGGSVHVQWNLR